MVPSSFTVWVPLKVAPSSMVRLLMIPVSVTVQVEPAFRVTLTLLTPLL